MTRMWQGTTEDERRAIMKTVRQAASRYAQNRKAAKADKIGDGRYASPLRPLAELAGIDPAYLEGATVECFAGTAFVVFTVREMQG